MNIFDFVNEAVMKEKCSEVKSYRIKFQFYPGPYKLDDINNS